jgi:hypothetical protein
VRAGRRTVALAVEAVVGIREFDASTLSQMPPLSAATTKDPASDPDWRPTLRPAAAANPQCGADATPGPGVQPPVAARRSDRPARAGDTGVPPVRLCGIPEPVNTPRWLALVDGEGMLGLGFDEFDGQFNVPAQHLYQQANGPEGS